MNDAYATYSVNFGGGVNKVDFNARIPDGDNFSDGAGGPAGGKVEIHLDSPTGTLVATKEISGPKSNNWAKYLNLQNLNGNENSISTYNLSGQKLFLSKTQIHNGKRFIKTTPLIAN